MSQQSTNHLLMIRPAAFQYNEQTAESNDYQQKQPKSKKKEVLKRAIEEFNAMVELLKLNGINVHVIDDTAKPEKPDAVFPNNWFTTHSDGKVFLYPMKSENRRLERRPEIVDYLRENFKVKVVLDWSFYEKDNRALEGTGSMVFDHQRKIIYACHSPRTDEFLLKKFAKVIGYKCLLFESFKMNNAPQYHTNVVMCVGTAFVIICLESIPSEKEREKIKKSILQGGKELIEITQDQLENNFAGNMLEVQNEEGARFVMMSNNAFNGLTTEQKESLGKHAQLLHTDLSTIETVGGGSARCMMAEIFLKPKE